MGLSYGVPLGWKGIIQLYWMLNDEELTVLVPEVLLTSNCNTLGQNHIILAKVIEWCESPPCVCKEECLIPLSNITGKQLMFLLNYFKRQSKIFFYWKQLDLLISACRCHNLRLFKAQEAHELCIAWSRVPRRMTSLLSVYIIVLASVAELGSSRFRVSISPQQRKQR